MQTVFNQTLTLFLVLIMGLIAAKTKMFTKEVRSKLSAFLLNVSSPALILVNFQIEYSAKLLKNMGIVVVAAFAIIGAGLIVGKFIWKKAPQEKNEVLRYATAFPNCGYLGIPVLGGLFGTEGVIYTSAFIMSFNIYMWTFGIKIFSGKSEKWYMPFIRPAIISIVLGIIIFIFSIQLPTPLYDALSMVGGMTSPLAMLLVGSFLADSKLKDIFADKYIYILSILRFIVWPGIMFFALKPFNLPQVVFACCVLISSMPAAANTVILATSYEKNPKFASETVALTTLIALATIPVWMYFITG